MSVDMEGTVGAVTLWICAIAVAFACSRMPTVTPTVTPAPTPTPLFVSLPPPEFLADLIAAEAGYGFHYVPWHYVAGDSVVWLMFGWPEEDDRLYKAVFGMVGGEWALLGMEPVGEEMREASIDGLNEQATDFH